MDGDILKNQKYSLDKNIELLKSFNFPFVDRFTEYEFSELIEQAERISELSNSYIRFLNYSKNKSTK